MVKGFYDYKFLVKGPGVIKPDSFANAKIEIVSKDEEGRRESVTFSGSEYELRVAPGMPESMKLTFSPGDKSQSLHVP